MPPTAPPPEERRDVGREHGGRRALRAADRIRLERQGATSDAARLAAAHFPSSMAQPIAAGPEFLSRAQAAAEVARPRLAIDERVSPARGVSHPMPPPRVQRGQAFR